MKGLHVIEAIGGMRDGSTDGPQVGPRPWCAEITGLSATYGFSRRFLRPRIDWSKSNSRGTRGIFLYYALDEGTYYETNYPLSWSRWAREFITVDGAGRIVEVEEDVVRSWVQRHLNVSRIEPS